MKHNKLTCYYCKGKFPREELIIINSKRKSCKSCYDNLDKENKKSEEDPVEDISYKELIEYICNGFGLKAPTGKQLKEIKRFKSLGYSHRDIQWTIYYIEAVVGRRLNGELGLVSYYYEQAMNHFEIIRRNEQFVNDADVFKEIVIKACRKDNVPRIDKTRLIDIDSIL